MFYNFFPINYLKFNFIEYNYYIVQKTKDTEQLKIIETHYPFYDF